MSFIGIRTDGTRPYLITPEEIYPALLFGKSCVKSSLARKNTFSIYKQRSTFGQII